MDMTGCPPGYATDRAFEDFSLEAACGTSLAVYWGLFMAVAKQTCHWRRLNREQNRKGRYPVALTLVSFYVALLLTLIIGIGVGFANTANGISFMLLSLLFMFYAAYMSLILWKYVRLGTRIIPLARDVRVNASHENQSLARLNGVGKALVVFQLLSLVASSVVLIILDPLDPSSHPIHGTIGFAFKAGFQGLLVSGVILQLWRCVRVVRSMRKRLADQNMAESQALESLSASIRVMYHRIFLTAIVGSLSPVQFALVAFNVLPRTVWWVFFFSLANESLIAFITEFFIVTQKPGKKKARGEVGDAGELQPSPFRATASGRQAVAMVATNSKSDSSVGPTVHPHSTTADPRSE